MNIDYIYIKNFRQYVHAKIEFAQASPRNFTIIQGANGAGKTNLLNAITWCLFGEEKHVDNKYKGLPIVNTAALDTAGKGIIDLIVEIQFVQSDGKKILITRNLSFKESGGKLVEVPPSHAPPTLMRETERDWVGPIHGSDAEYIINSIIPPSLEEYFFFDGERMNDYFRESTGKDIKNAVFEISQLELFETLIEHLSKRKNEFVKLQRGLSSKAEDIRADLEVQNRSWEVDKEQLEELNKKEKEAELLEREFRDKLKDSTAESIKHLEEQRVTLESYISQVQDDIVDLESDRLKLLHRHMPTIFAYEPLLKTKTLIDGRREAGLIPPLYQAIFIKNLLKKGKCLCGSDITEKDEYSSGRRKRVQTYLEDSELSDMSTELITSNIHIQELIEDVVGFPEHVINIDKKLKNLQGLKEEKNDMLQKISKEIKQSNVENIKSWEEQQQKYGQEKDQLKVKVALKERDIERRGNIIRALNSELKRELKKESKHDSLIRLLALCDEGITSAEQVMTSIMKKVKQEVEERASKQFLTLIWKKETYKGLVIDDDYNISVPDTSGREALGTLSAGERQVCALSFMAALNSVSGFEAPIVIDTPLGRISREPRRNIAENLPDYLKGTQVTLLVTEEEYTPEVRKALSRVIGKEYTINFWEKEMGKMAEVELLK
jgi:DNA sulfur modification protein DndD